MFLGLIFGFLLGYFVPNETLKFVMKQYLVIELFLLLLFAMLKINYHDFVKNIKRIDLVILLTFLKIIVLPVATFFAAQYLPQQFLLGFVLIASVPAAMAAPGLLLMFRGNTSLSLVITVITNLLAPFSIPLVFKYTVGTTIEMEILPIFIFLLIMVLGPFIIALLMEKFVPKKVHKINQYSEGIVAMILVSFAIAMIAPYSREIVSNLEASLFVVLITFIFFLVLHFLPLVFTFRKGKTEIATYIVIFTYSNVGLAIVLAARYFDSTTVLMTVIYDVFWALGMIPMQLIFAKKRS